MRSKRLKALSIQECIPVGCVPAAHWPYAGRGGGGIQSRGGLPGLGGLGLWSRGGLPSPGGVSGPGGVCLVWGGLWSRGGFSLADPPARENPPPPVNRMTDRCKNITLATTSLRPVIIKSRSLYVCDGCCIKCDPFSTDTSLVSYITLLTKPRCSVMRRGHYKWCCRESGQ